MTTHVAFALVPRIASLVAVAALAYVPRGSVAAEPAAPAADAEVAEVAAVEVRPRAGLPNFFATARAGGDVKVAYFGGSITSAPGWRVRSLAWLAKRFPGSRFSEIDAAIGGTCADLGSFRVGRDVIAGRPDLVFVEFAVNDGGTSPPRLVATLEGIVRQIRRALPATDICFVYTLAERDLPDLAAGRCQRSAAVMETVADHYGIPSVHFGVEVNRRIAAGTLVFKGQKPEPFDPQAVPVVFSTDGVHPLFETGHAIYAESLARSLITLDEAGGTAAPHPLPAPLRADNWEAATLLPITPDMLRGDWRRPTPDDDPQAKTFTARLPSLWLTEEPGATVAFRVTVPGEPGGPAREASVFDLIGPGAGIVTVRVDGGVPRQRPRLDGYCTYWRIATLPLGELEPGEHLVEIALSAEKPDKAKILYDWARADIDKDPAKYEAQRWYAAGLLVFGTAAGVPAPQPQAAE